jgi:cytochrome oxidase assembly protein ShyY1
VPDSLAMWPVIITVVIILPLLAIAFWQVRRQKK